MTATGILERVRALLGDRADVVEKRMVGGRSFSRHDEMFCGVTSAGLVVRVGRDAVASSVFEPHVAPMTLGGKQLAAFVVVGPEALAADRDLERWVQRGLDFLDRTANDAGVPDGGPAPAEARFADLVTTLTRHDDVDPPGTGRGFGASALKVGRSIFAMLVDERLVVKLPRDRVASLIASGAGLPFTAGKATPMREWVQVVDDTPDTWTALAEEARAFVGG